MDLNIYNHLTPQGRGTPTTADVIPGITSHGW